MAGAPSPVITQASTLHQPLPHKEITANKRVSIQSPSCFSSVHSVESSSSSSFSSGLSGSKVLLVDEDSNEKLKTLAVVLSDRRTILFV
jgi:hypothetical protein